MRGGELKKVSDLFSKYREKLIAPQSSVVSALVEVVDDLMGIKIKPEQVDYSTSTRTLHLRLPAVLRQEIQRNKGDILLHLKGRLGERNAPKELV